MNMSSESTKVILPLNNKIIKKEKRNENLKSKRGRKQVCRILPIEKNWKQYNNIINFGGYMIDLDYQMDDSLYTITERARAIKQVSNIQKMEFNKINRSLQIFYSQKYPYSDYYKQIKDYSRLESIINILKSRNDQNLYYLSELIQQYNDKLNEHFHTEKLNHEVNKKISNSEENLQNYKIKKEEFIQYINDNVLKQKQPFFTYSIIGKNPQTFEYDSICYGFSEGLLALLGTSLETAPDIFMRMGIVDFVNRKSRFYSLIASIKTFIERKVQEPFLIDIRSYDFIEFPAIKTYQRIVKDHNYPFELQAFIHTYEVEDYQLLQAIEKRRSSLHNSTTHINNLDDPDFIYTCQQEYFLEKYYNIKKEKLDE